MKNTILICLLFLFSAFKHPFYLGVVDLKYNAKEKALQGSVKLFTNDFEAALKKISKQSIDLIHPTDRNATQKLVEAYLKDHLSITINGSPKTIHLLGFEQEQEATWMYIEIRDCPEPKKIVFDNTLLYEHLKEQSNIMHLEVKGQEKSFKLNNPEQKAEFGF